MFVDSTPIELFDNFRYDGVRLSSREFDSISIVSVRSLSSIIVFIICFKFDFIAVEANKAKLNLTY